MTRLTARTGPDGGEVPLLTALLEREGTVEIAGTTISYQQIRDDASSVAARVAGSAVVAVEAAADVRTVVAIVGCLLAGVPVVPVPPDSGPAERAHILGDSGATITLTPADVTGSARSGSARSGSARSGFSFPAEGELTSSPALILYTSGTTGAPKGVPVSRAAVAAGLDALAEAWEWTADDVLVHGLPLFHVHGLVLGVLGALRVGSPLVHTGRPKPELYSQAAARGGTLFFGVPTVWSRVAADPASAAALRSARLMVSGSAPLPAPVFERLAELTGQAPVERYGMTETLITVSTRASGDRRAGFVGTPLAGVHTRLVDDEGLVVLDDGSSVGELQVKSPTVFSGYLGRPEATAASFTMDGWFRTGDVATIGPDGWHKIVGRASTDLIKSGGYRIGAGEIEDCLLGLPGVQEVAVIGRPDPDLGERVTAFVVSSSPMNERDVIDHVANLLSAHKRPRDVVFVDSLPRNPMGKVLKKQLS